jgi:putative membrane protein
MSADQGTMLALQRTQLAAERTLMAWIRTAFSMISFGFTIGKFLEYLHKQPGEVGETGGGNLPRILVLLGLTSLVVGVLEFRRSMKVLERQAGQEFHTASVGIIAGLVAVIGVVAFLSLLFHNRFV